MSQRGASPHPQLQAHHQPVRRQRSSSVPPRSRSRTALHYLPAPTRHTSVTRANRLRELYVAPGPPQPTHHPRMPGRVRRPADRMVDDLHSMLIMCPDEEIQAYPQLLQEDIDTISRLPRLVLRLCARMNAWLSSRHVQMAIDRSHAARGRPNIDAYDTLMHFLQGQLTPRTRPLFESLDDEPLLLRFLDGSRMSPHEMHTIRNNFAEEGQWNRWVRVVYRGLFRLLAVDDQSSDPDYDDDSQDTSSDSENNDNGMEEEEENDEEDE